MIEPLKRAIAKVGRLRLIDIAYLQALHEQQHLKRLFQFLDVDIVFDVGANAGQYAKRLRNEVGYRGAIVSFEPIPELVDCLDHARQGDADWHIEQVAITDRSGSISFNVMRDLQCSSLEEPDTSETKLFEAQTSITRRISVDGVRLDDQMQKWLGQGAFKRPFLKLDTQGHDFAIVNSCSRLREFVGFQSELSVKRLYKDTPGFEEAINAYCNLGFDVSALVPNNGIGFPQLFEIDCIMVRSDLANVKVKPRE